MGREAWSEAGEEGRGPIVQGQLSHDKDQAQGAAEDLEQEVTPAAAGGFAEVQVEQVVAGTRVVPSEAGRSMLL